MGAVEEREGPWRVDEVLTLPNALSVLRLLGVPLFLWAILTGRDGLALITLMASGITDYLDGKLARALGMTSRVGALLDPLADRLYIFTTVVALAWRDVIPWWLVVLLVARDAVLAVLLLVAGRQVRAQIPVHFVGKAATFNLLYAFPLLLLADGRGTLADLALPLGWAFAWWGVWLYWISIAIYGLEVTTARRTRGAARAT
ncbi:MULTISPECIES: CDP-alcohol phosphatidyltransferase family protein [Janibacter]|uniref:Cardiolipin synthase n=1 Tax=Janibacter indicus TaxID=857417 RepID=A0A1W2C4F1_9MICO|nr:MULTISPECIES: CDP-alcohol phosphatidyltransferase family protein [Janibacter]QNF95594.1 CDP-alcohol phosphatidyltransferase family protein [Janibacter sp. YB324]SMC79976.1 cardiolipin synthase [Janibacter indicus]